MTKMLYLLLTFLESVPAVFGIRAFAAEAPYRVVAKLDDGVEVRAYAPGWVVETSGGSDGFSRLFAYIAGSNEPSQTITMTAPVEQRFGADERPTPGWGDAEMRFFLPAKAGDPPPKPDDARVRLVHLPERMVAALRYSGSFGARRFEAKAADLRRVLAAAGRKTEGASYFMGYDPPFALPFLRRNEAAIDLQSEAQRDSPAP